MTLYAGADMDHRQLSGTNWYALRPALPAIAALVLGLGRCQAGDPGLTASTCAPTPAVEEARQRRALSVGWATADITPTRPVALVGQLYKRISTGVRDPLTATVLALETQGGDKPEQAILVSSDLLFIQRAIQMAKKRTNRVISDSSSR